MLISSLVSAWYFFSLEQYFFSSRALFRLLHPFFTNFCHYPPIQKSYTSTLVSFPFSLPTHYTFSTQSPVVPMFSLSNCTVCTRDESIWSSFSPNNFKSSTKRRWLTLNPSQDHNPLLIFSIPMFSNESKHTKKITLENKCLF